MRNTLLDYTARNITRSLSDCQLLCSLLRAPVSLVQLTLNQHSLICYELHHARGELAQCRATSRQKSCRGASSPTRCWSTELCALSSSRMQGAQSVWIFPLHHTPPQATRRANSPHPTHSPPQSSGKNLLHECRTYL